MLVAQGDLVGLGDVVGLDGPESCAEALASLPQQLEGVGGGALRGGTLRTSPVFLDEVGMQGCGDFYDRLQRVLDGPIPPSVVNHRVSIAPPRVSGPRGTRATLCFWPVPRSACSGTARRDRQRPAGRRIVSWRGRI